MNTALQNQTLAGDALRAGTSTARAGASKLPLQFGADDAALPFKRLLSELKQGGSSAPHAAALAAPLNTALTAPPVTASPAPAAAPSPAARSERPAQPAAESKADSARHESNRLQARRSQAQASEQALERTRAQLARTNSARPGDGVVAAPIQHQPQPAAPVQGQPEDGSDSACPAEESQLNAGADASSTAGAAAAGQDPATQSRIQRCLGLMPAQDAELDDKTRTAAGTLALLQGSGGAQPGTENRQEDGRVRAALDGSNAEAAAVAGSASGTGLGRAGQENLAAQLPVAAELVGEGRGARARDAGRSERGAAGEQRRSGPLAATELLAQTDKISGMAGGVASSALATDEKSGSASFAGELQTALGRSSAAAGAGNASARGAESSLAGALDGLRAAAPTPTGANGAAEPTVLTMNQALHDPSFAPELGARLSLLAADGVQQAQLHLNPAEMGPVAIQIQLDGQQAQISFQAENAETCKVLEQGLPDLAAALREAGLTLSGGGVFQQSSEGRKGQQDQADGRSVNLAGLRSLAGGDDLLSAGPAGRPGATRQPQGMLDLYA